MSLSLRQVMAIALVGAGAAGFGVAGAAEKSTTEKSTQSKMTTEKASMTARATETLTSPPPRIIPPTVKPDLSEYGPVAELAPVHFDFDRATLRPADLRTVDATAEWLKKNPTPAVIVEGYADERGNRDYNMALGERRARALRDALIARGVPSSRFAMASYGEARPLCRQHGEPCWQSNRAAGIVVEATRPQTP